MRARARHIDMAGLSQKNGAVVTPSQDRPTAGRYRRRPHRRRRRRSHSRLRSRVTSASERVLATASRARTAQSSTRHQTMPAQFTAIADLQDSRPTTMRLQIEARTGPGATHSSTRPRLRPRCLAIPSPPISSPSALPGSRAWSRCGAEAIEKAIELNGDAVKMNSRPSSGEGARPMTAPPSRRSSPPRGGRIPRPRRGPRLRRRWSSAASPSSRPIRMGAMPGRYKAFVDKVVAAEDGNRARLDDPEHGGCPLSLQADGLQGRI